MKRIFVLWLILIAAVVIFRESEGAVPPRPGQPHDDIFPSGSSVNLQDYNPVTVKAKAQRTASYRLVTMSGCYAGTVPSDMQRLERELAEDVAFTLVRDDSDYDFTVRVNCGSEQIRICGSVNIFCLGRGFPFIADVEVSDVISQWPESTRLSILCHEICGHAIGTWHEQYCLGTETFGVCAGLARFTPAPNWPDFMNTGPLSRHLIEDIERERWARTMYEIEAVDPCEGPTDIYGNRWDNCLARWIRPNGWRYDPFTGNEETPAGVLEWLACNSDSLRWNLYLSAWFPVGHGFYEPTRGFWSSAPPC